MLYIPKEGISVLLSASQGCRRNVLAGGRDEFEHPDVSFSSDFRHFILEMSENVIFTCQEKRRWNIKLSVDVPR